VYITEQKQFNPSIKQNQPKLYILRPKPHINLGLQTCL